MNYTDLQIRWMMQSVLCISPLMMWGYCMWQDVYLLESTKL